MLKKIEQIKNINNKKENSIRKRSITKVLVAYLIFCVIVIFTFNVNAANQKSLNISSEKNGTFANVGDTSKEDVYGEDSNSEGENVEDEKVNVEEIQKEVIETSSDVEELSLNSRIALIYDRASGSILYEKNGNKQTPMASTTKIMTAIVVLENANLKDTVTITAKATGVGGSRLGLKKNDKITVNDLLYGLMLRSGNDAAVALAIHVGGSVEGFAQMMNEKAQELGLTSSHFVVPHGLDNDGHYTTAYELAKMADYALNMDKFKEIVATKSTTIYINGYARAINNTNQLLGSVSGVYGVKTGFTNGAGRCLVTACKRDDLDIITVIIGADTTKIRTADTIKLIQYAYNNFEIVNIKEIVEAKFNQWLQINQGRIYVNKGIKNNVELYLEELPFENMAIYKMDVDKIEIEVNSIFYLEAPVKENQIIANVKIMINGKVIEVLEVYTQEAIRKKEIQDYLVEFLNIPKEGQVLFSLFHYCQTG